jgi:hypothetical protein
MRNIHQQVACQLTIRLTQIKSFIKGKDFKMNCHGQETYKQIAATKT